MNQTAGAGRTPGIELTPRWFRPARPFATVPRRACSNLRRRLAGAERVPIVGSRIQRARSSAGEHYVDIVGVAGSIPAAPTTICVGIGITWPFGHVMRGQRYWPRYEVSIRRAQHLSSRTRPGRRFRSEFTLTPSVLAALRKLTVSGSRSIASKRASIWSQSMVERRRWPGGARTSLGPTGRSPPRSRKWIGRTPSCMHSRNSDSMLTVPLAIHLDGE